MNISIQEAIEILKNDSENLIRVMGYYGTDVIKNQCKCPFHSDKHPSMAIKGNRYKCFTKSCNAGGDLIDFIRQKEGIDILGAIKKAIEILGLNYTIEKDKLDNLREYIEVNFKTWYKDDNYKFEDVYFYKNKDNNPVLARIKFKNKINQRDML